MHPILSNPRRRRVFAAAWAPIGALVGALPFWAAGGPFSEVWPFVLWGEALAAPILASWFICRFAPISAGAGRIVTMVGGAAVVTGALWVGAGRAWITMVATAGSAPDLLFPRLAPLAFGAAVVLFIAMSAVHYGLAAADESQAVRRRALEADIIARESELRALRAQIDPHFLFNCLHSISALIGSQPSAARQMCLELAEFFRESLRVGSQSRIPLGLEAALVEQYLAIEQVRYGDRLRVDIMIAPDAEGALVPPLLLQPLAENAVRHGVATLVDGGDVTIAIVRRGDYVDVRVENPYDAADSRRGAGVGLTNVRARLEATYGSRAELRVDATGARFTAALSLPIEDAA
jgi:histidine kinase